MRNEAKRNGTLIANPKANFDMLKAIIIENMKKTTIKKMLLLNFF